jgi:hypothetical protein
MRIFPLINQFSLIPKKRKVKAIPVTGPEDP